MVSATNFVVIPLLAAALSFIITGSLAGYYIRLIGYVVLHKIKLDELVFCPSCCATWLGFYIRLLRGGHDILRDCIEAALISYLLTAILQAAFGLAANDRGQIEFLLKGRNKQEK